MGRFQELKENFSHVYREEGFYALADRVGVHAREVVSKVSPFKKPHDDSNDFVDVLFINGCDYSVPHPIRYRVNHQAEQLEAIGMSTRIVNAWEWDDDLARIARSFIIFRCPYADIIGHIIELIHELNKRVYFDIDDLVIDTKYTDQIPYLASLSKDERAQYDDGVRRMGKTMSLCDGAITTTEELASELRNYLGTVFVNRNVASEEMLRHSEMAVQERDVFPFTDESDVKPRDRHRWKLANKRHAEREGFSIGYFSGSITHNDDFEMILPSIVRFMAEYPDVKLHVVGELDLPAELQPFQDRVVRLPFSPWRRLPQMISFVDVNLIPLCDTIFNRAKSENKWVEAGLVKVPSIASNVGALADSITDGIDGILCDTPDDWYDALVSLKDDKERRLAIAKKAYDECRDRHVTCGTGMALASFIREHETRNIAFALPGLDISGGVLVALKHAEMLRKKGLDVTLLGDDAENDEKWFDLSGMRLPVISRDRAHMRGRFDKMVATMWTTVSFAKYYENIAHRYYLVQNRETGFYRAGGWERFEASKTYGINERLTYCTISPWCRRWLTEQYGHEVRYAPNGIDLSLFSPVERDWSGKIRILVEGDSKSEYKNVDESFKIIDLLDKEKFEIWYLSYRGKPKASYRVDRYFNSIPHEQVGEIYQQCHILLKTSILESFSYPPLEMMATGGQAVVLRNEGNAAYLVDGENGLLFDKDEDEKAAALINELCADESLRERLRQGGLDTASGLAWEKLADQILALYDE